MFWNLKSNKACVRILPMVPLEILPMVPLVANGTTGNQRTLNVSGANVTIGRNVATNATSG